MKPMISTSCRRCPKRRDTPWGDVSAQRREETGYGKDGFTYVSNYAQDHPHPDYTADDDRFAALWDRRLEEIFPGENRVRCWHYTDDGELDWLDFDYTGY